MHGTVLRWNVWTLDLLRAICSDENVARERDAPRLSFVLERSDVDSENNDRVLSSMATSDGKIVVGAAAVCFQVVLAVASRWRSLRALENVSATLHVVMMATEVVQSGATLLCDVQDYGTYAVKIDNAGQEARIVALGQFFSASGQEREQEELQFNLAAEQCALPVQLLHSPSPWGVLSSVQVGNDTALGKLDISQLDDDTWGELVLHPAVLEDIVLLCACAVTDESHGNKSSPKAGDFRFNGCGKILFLAKPNGCSPDLAWIRAQRTSDGGRVHTFTVLLCTSDGVPWLVLKETKLTERNQPPPTPPPEVELRLCNQEVGILAFEYYCPQLCVRATDIEKLHGITGRYTAGRGQENVTFCSDDEDAVSMALTALRRLVDRCKLRFSEIGRLEVGTESQVDHAKSIKSFLMTLFETEGVYDVQGTDTYNACYGGTNALFNAINWVTSASWNGKYAVVICTDVAVHPDPANLSSIGASAVAMLIGPQASLVIDPCKVTFIKDTWDFFRPIGWHNNDAFVDMDQATAQYDDALRWCLDCYSEEVGTTDLLSQHEFVAFHCNAPYHAKRSLRVLWEHQYGEVLSKEQHTALYQRHTEAGTLISAQNATTYTYPLYACLLSLVLDKDQDLIGKRVLCYSYGSGCAASLYSIRVRSVPQYPRGLLQSLRSRTPKSIDETLQLVNAFENTYGRFGFTPSHFADRQIGVYYLKGVSATGVRAYEQHTKTRLRTDKSHVGVTKIELQQETLDPELIMDLLATIEPGRIHVFTSACENFCVGGSHAGDIDLEWYLSDALPRFAELIEALSKCTMPTIVVCHGATRGGGMLFPALADVVVATHDASFGLPEIRRGVLPALVLVPLQKRVHHGEMRKWMMRGSAVSSAEAQSAGLVDCIVQAAAEASEAVEKVLKGLRTRPPALLEAQQRLVTSGWGLAKAVVETGFLALHCQPGSADGAQGSGKAAVVSWPSPGVALVELSAGHLTWGTAKALQKCLQSVASTEDLKSIVVDACKVSNARDEGVSGWILDSFGSTAQHSLDTIAASLYCVSATFANLFSDTPVPVSVVVGGEVRGAALAMVFSADYTVAVDGSSFDLTNRDVNFVFANDRRAEWLIGDASWAKLSRSPNRVIDVASACELGLVSARGGRTPASARAHVLQLATQVARAPAAGVRATVSLLRQPKFDALLAQRCVLLAQGEVSSSLAAPHSTRIMKMQQIVGDADCERTACVVLDEPIDVKTLLARLSESSCRCNYLLLHFKMEGDLQETDTVSDDLISLLLWFHSSRPYVFTTFAETSRPQCVLVPLLSDVAFATPSVQFKGTAMLPIVMVCLTAKLGSQGRGRVLLHGDAGMSANEAQAVGLIEKILSPDDDVIAAAREFVGHAHRPARIDPRKSIAESVVAAAFRRRASLDTWGDANVVIEEGVARVKLPAVSGLLKMLETVEQKLDGIRAIVIDASDRLPDAVFENDDLDALTRACCELPEYKIFRGVAHTGPEGTNQVEESKL